MMNKSTIKFDYTPNYDNNNDDVDVHSILPSVSYEVEIPEFGVTISDMQFHFNAYLRSIGYVIDFEDH